MKTKTSKIFHPILKDFNINSKIITKKIKDVQKNSINSPISQILKNEEKSITKNMFLQEKKLYIDGNFKSNSRIKNYYSRYKKNFINFQFEEEKADQIKNILFNQISPSVACSHKWKSQRAMNSLINAKTISPDFKEYPLSPKSSNIPLNFSYSNK